ncbi:MAG: hypothetical protein ACRETQ_11375 [Gammaproteobacteria bacterium]
MDRLLRLSGIFLIAALTLGNSQCQQSSKSQINPPTGIPPTPAPPGNGPAFVTSVTVEDGNGDVTSSFASGENIQFVVSVRNRTNSQQSVTIQVCGPFAETAVVEAGTADVVATGVAPQVNCDAVNLDGVPLTFAPDQTVTYTIPWNQLTGAGTLVPPGNYEVMGGIYCWNPPPGGGPVGSYDTTDCMAPGVPTPAELMPTQFRSNLVAFTIQ